MVKNMEPQINYQKLDENFELFCGYVLVKKNVLFKSFAHPFMVEHEAYKMTLHSAASVALNVNHWQPSDIGSGKILGCVLNAIGQPNNNLGAFHGRKGEKSDDHYGLKQARINGQLSSCEQLFYEFFTDQISDAEAFRRIVELAGGRYPLLGYLFFLKDYRRYVPIRPKSFDKLFVRLDIELKLAWRCSWSKYQQFCRIIADTQEFLAKKLHIPVLLLDAHSFLWILSWVPDDEKEGKIWQTIAKPSTATVPMSTEIIATRALPRKELSDKAFERESRNSTSVDFDEISRIQRLIGEQSEDFVIRSERQRLTEAGRRDLAARVTFVGGDPSLGYDIDSFETDEAPRRIEVKTIRVNGNERSFFISESELKKSQGMANYYLFLVTWLNGRPHSIRHIRQPQFRSEERFTLEPYQHIVRFEEVE